MGLTFSTPSFYAREELVIGQHVQVICSFAPAKYFESNAFIVRHLWTSRITYFDTYEIKFDDGVVMKVSRNNIKPIE